MGQMSANVTQVLDFTLSRSLVLFSDSLMLDKQTGDPCVGRCHSVRRMAKDTSTR
jgi:hypothetical protein